MRIITIIFLIKLATHQINSMLVRFKIYMGTFMEGSSRDVGENFIRHDFYRLIKVEYAHLNSGWHLGHLN